MGNNFDYGETMDIKQHVCLQSKQCLSLFNYLQSTYCFPCFCLSFKQIHAIGRPFLAGMRNLKAEIKNKKISLKKKK